MKETLYQPSPSPLPHSYYEPLHGRQRKWGPARIALLLVLLAFSLGFLAWMTILDAPIVSPRENGGRTNTRNDLPRDRFVSSSSGSLQEILAQPDTIPTHHHSLLGRPAPDFELADLDGKAWKLSELRDGRAVVVIFYYGYRCHSCVRQLFAVNRDLPLFHELGARVVAISADPPELTSRGFQQNGPFDFPVLSDPGDKVAQAYQVFKRTLEGKLAESRRHGTFVIDRHGTIQWVNVGDAPLRRNPTLLFQLAKLEGRLPSAQSGQ